MLDPRSPTWSTDVLREALERGSGAAVRRAGVRSPAAGKTGTSNGGVDAWFVGYTPRLVGGVWIGFDRPRPVTDAASGGAWRRRSGAAWSSASPAASRRRPGRSRTA